MSKLIAIFYYLVFVSVIFGRITKSGFLLLGGVDDDLNLLDNVEVYGSNLSLPSLPSLPFPLAEHIAEMTESGAIFVTGGVTSGSNFSDNINDKTWMLSSLSSSKWEEMEARMPIPVYETASVVVGDIILVMGGDFGSANFSDCIQMLNTNQSLPSWKLLNQTLPRPLLLHSAAVFEGQVIIVTRYGVTYTTSVSSIISEMELDWVEGKLPDVEEGTPGHSVEVVEGKLVAVLGKQVFTKTTMDSQWVQLKPMPQEKWYYPSIGSVRGNIVIGGGLDGERSSVRTTAKVFMWMEASNEWEEVRSLNVTRQDHATVQLPRGDYNYYPSLEEKPTTSTNRTSSPNNR